MYSILILVFLFAGCQLTTLKEQVPPIYCKCFLSPVWPAKIILVLSLIYIVPYGWQILIAHLWNFFYLKIETVMSDIPIGVVGNSCPNLVELQVVNGRIALDDGHSCSDASSTFLANLKLMYLFLVEYHVVERPVGVGEERISPLQCLLTHAKGIQVIQATGCPGNLVFQVEGRRAERS